MYLGGIADAKSHALKYRLKLTFIELEEKLKYLKTKKFAQGFRKTTALLSIT